MIRLAWPPPPRRRGAARGYERRAHLAPRAVAAGGRPSPHSERVAVNLGQHLVPAPSRELPVAVARPRDLGARKLAARGAVDRWLVARWRLVEPRLLPALLAALCVAISMLFAAAMLRLDERVAPSDSARPAADPRY